MGTDPTPADPGSGLYTKENGLKKLGGVYHFKKCQQSKNMCRVADQWWVLLKRK
jgi:hypothetical protein